MPVYEGILHEQLLSVKISLCTYGEIIGLRPFIALLSPAAITDRLTHSASSEDDLCSMVRLARGGFAAPHCREAPFTTY